MKHSTPEEDLELASLLSLNELQPLIVSTNTSTPEGMRWRRHRLEVESEIKYIANMLRKYVETGNKTYLVAINNITDQGDNIPTHDE